MKRTMRALKHSLLNRTAAKVALFRVVPRNSGDRTPRYGCPMHRPCNVAVVSRVPSAMSRAMEPKWSDMIKRSPDQHANTGAPCAKSPAMAAMPADRAGMSRNLIVRFCGLLVGLRAWANKLCSTTTASDEHKFITHYVVTAGAKLEFEVDDMYEVWFEEAPSYSMLRRPTDRVHELLRFLVIDKWSKPAVKLLLAYLLAYARLVLGLARRTALSVRLWSAALSEALACGPLGPRPPPALFA